MNTKEKHVEENNVRHDEKLIAESMPAGAKMQKRHNSSKSNRLWLWLGVIILVFILVYWLFSIGIFEDMTGVING
ncbi:MAG: hypothetical protein J6C81_02540 [Muribaculaceae bacterium]|nr:hypothetical protein [Muribaculaceae bacterium]